jgi:hypothetical protein
LGEPVVAFSSRAERASRLEDARLGRSLHLPRSRATVGRASARALPEPKCGRCEERLRSRMAPSLELAHRVIPFRDRASAHLRIPSDPEHTFRLKPNTV